MISLQRNKRVLYLCKRIENDITFEKPKKKLLNYQRISSTGEMLALGEEYSMYLNVTCTPKEAKDFSDKDRCYVFKKPPIEHDKFCNEADYIVDGEPIITLNEATISLRKLSGDKY